MAQVSPDQITGLFRNLPLDLMQSPPTGQGGSPTSAYPPPPGNQPTYIEHINMGMPPWEAAEIATRNARQEIQDRKATEIAQKDQEASIKNAQGLVDSTAFDIGMSNDPTAIFRGSLDPEIVAMVKEKFGLTPKKDVEAIMQDIGTRGPGVAQPQRFNRIEKEADIQPDAQMAPTPSGGSGFQDFSGMDPVIAEAMAKQERARAAAAQAKADAEATAQAIAANLGVASTPSTGGLGLDPELQAALDEQEAAALRAALIRAQIEKDKAPATKELTDREKKDLLDSWELRRDKFQAELQVKHGEWTQQDIDEATRKLAVWYQENGTYLEDSHIPASAMPDDDWAMSQAFKIVAGWASARHSGLKDDDEEDPLDLLQGIDTRDVTLDDPLASQSGAAIFRKIYAQEEGDIPTFTNAPAIIGLTPKNQYNVVASKTLGAKAHAQGSYERLNSQYMPTLGAFVLQVLGTDEWGHVGGVDYATDENTFHNWIERGFKEPSDTFWKPHVQDKSWYKLTNASMGGGPSASDDHWAELANQDEWMQAAAMRVAGLGSQSIFGELRNKSFNSLLQRYAMEQSYATGDERINLPKWLSQIEGSPWAEAKKRGSGFEVSDPDPDV